MQIIAEIGLNHNGSLKLAKQMVDEVRSAGANVAKFQFFDASEYFTPDFEWYEACMKARFDLEQFKGVKKYCDQQEIEFMASVFNLEGVAWAETLAMKRYKIPSRAIKQRDLIDKVCATGKDVIASLGMWDGEEFPDIKTKGKVDFLYCVAKYPTLPEDLDLDNIDFKRYAGFSDHTIGLEAALRAVAKGAEIIEKHFTLDKKMYGPDHSGSMEPDELRELVNRAKEYEK